ncbi:MAG: DUF5667 domain-containing protein [Candidatus Gracilibacteria bacterium]
MKELNTDIAKKRIWNSLKDKLPDRGFSVYQNELSSLRLGVSQVKVSRLKKVQSKESLLDILPDRVPAFTPVRSFFPKKVFAFASLCSLFSILLVPVLRFAPSVSAMRENTLQVVEGEVYVNESLVSGTVALQVGDKIATGDDSMAHIMFIDDSRLTMGPGTSINIVNADLDPENRALTRVSIYQESGRSFAQVVNLVSPESFFEIDFSGGYVSTSQKSSFDVQVSDRLDLVAVARNFVNMVVNSGEKTYSGSLGQGALVTISDGINFSEISEAMQEDVWWSFNLAYSKSYARQLDESYKQENIERALILPGNPLYFLKTFRETVQVSFAFTDSAKTELFVEQAESRLNEAQTLIAQGNTELAKQTLDVYKDTVDKALASSGETANADLIALVDETQKEVAVSPSFEESDVLLNAGIGSASQKLQQVPELIDAGMLDEAILSLESYQNESMSMLAALQDVPMEDRDAMLSKLLEEKLADLQMLRVVASLPEIQGKVDIENAMLEQLSVMVLSLRERELQDLSGFFATNDATGDSYDLYSKLKDEAQMTQDLSDQFDLVEEQIITPTENVVVDVETVIDPRFSDTHSN